MRVELLGDVRLVTPTAVVEGAPLASRRVRIALAVLALERARAVDRHELAEAIWPRELPPTWASALRTVLSQTREALAGIGLGADALRADAGQVRLHLPAGSSTDIEEVIALTEAAEQAELAGDIEMAIAAATRSAEQLQRELLPFEDGAYLRSWRARLGTARQRALGIQASALVRGGRPHQAIAVAEQAVAAAPFDEDATRRLMSALAAAGDRAQALRAHTRLRVLLREELGVNPSPATERLYLDILMLDADPSPSAAVEDASVAGQPALPRPSLDDTLSSLCDPWFTGREVELAALIRWWTSVMSNSGGLMAIDGEPGVGKTRLAAELAVHAHERGALVLFGRCDEQASTAFQPFTEAARGWAGDEGSEQRLASWLTGAEGTPSSDRADERSSIFDALASWLLALSAEQPVLLVVDDIQWASPSTLIALERVVTMIRSAPVGVVTTQRRGRGGLADPVAIRIGELAGRGRVERIALQGLAAAGVGTLVAQLLTEHADRVGREVTGDLAERLTSATGGNAFLVRAAAHHLVGAGSLRIVGGETRLDPGSEDALLTPVIRDVMAARLAPLHAKHRDVLSVAAIVGHTFETAVVAEVAGGDSSRIIDALDAAEAVGLLVPERGSGLRLRFVHEMVRSFLLDGLSAARRASLNLMIGDVLARRSASPTRLAIHFHQGFELDPSRRAVPTALAAGEVAHDHCAFEDALVPLRRALELDLRDREQAELLVALGMAEVRVGERSTETWIAASAAAHAAGDGALVARAALGAVASAPDRSSWFGDAERQAMLERALEAIPPDAADLRVRVLAELALFTPARAERHALGHEALAIAERDGSAEVLAAAWRANLVARWKPQEAGERLRFADRLLSLDVLDRYERAEVALDALADVIQLGRRAEFEGRLATLEDDEAVRASRRLHWRIRVWHSAMALVDGRLSDAERIGGEALAMWGPAGDADATVAFGSLLAAVRFLQGRSAETLDLVAAARKRYPDVSGYSSAMALACAELGDLDGARNALADVTADGFAGIARDSSFLLAAACTAEALRAVGGRDAAADLYALVAPAAGMHIMLGGPGVFWGPVDHMLGVLAETTGDIDLAAVHFRDAVESARRLGARPWTARSQIALARTGERLVADDHLHRLVADARSTARELGLGLVERAAAALSLPAAT